jgi:hypothetical protein
MIFKIFFNKIANPIISENLHSTFTRRKHLHGRFISDSWVKIRNKRSVPKPDESINQKSKPKGLNSITKIDQGHLCLREENLSFNIKINQIFCDTYKTNFTNTKNQSNQIVIK